MRDGMKKRMVFGFALGFCVLFCLQAQAACRCPSDNGSPYTYDFEYLKFLSTYNNSWSWFYVYADDMVGGDEAESSLESRCCVPGEQHPVFQDPNIGHDNSKCVVVALEIPAHFASAVHQMEISFSNETQLAGTWLWWGDGGSPVTLTSDAEGATETKYISCNQCGRFLHTCRPPNYHYTASNWYTWGGNNFTNHSNVAYNNVVRNGGIPWDEVTFPNPSGGDTLCKLAALSNNTYGASEYLVAQLQKRPDANYYCQRWYVIKPV